jgi:tRNA-dihydrouridine synthase 1
MVRLASGRRPWFPKFRTALAATDSLEALERLLRFKVERWRGRPPRTMDSTENNDEETSGARDNCEEERSMSEDELGIAF